MRNACEVIDHYAEQIQAGVWISLNLMWIWWLARSRKRKPGDYSPGHVPSSSGEESGTKEPATVQRHL